MTSLSRRSFVVSAAAAAGLSLTARAQEAGAKPAVKAPVKPKLRQAIKYSMIAGDASVLEKFQLAKAVGFEGLELDSPLEIDRAQVVAARDATGVVVHGVIDSIHWQTRFSDPDEAVRAKAVEALRGAIADCALYGGTTVLVVPGVVRDGETENFQQVWKRSQAAIASAIPDAKKAKVKIAIEVVWNDFLKQPADLVKYVDEFGDPTVGAYFDASNMLKYGASSATWVRKLGNRLLKIDFKGYSKEKGWVGIGEGDEDWPEVLRALGEVGYDGWITAEVGAGDRAHLEDVKKRMDRILATS